LDLINRQRNTFKGFCFLEADHLMANFWQKIRKDFPITRRTIYLDHASAGPVSRPVAEAYTNYAQAHLNRADESWPAWVEKREEVRALAAAFIGAKPNEIAFTSSTSHGMNLIAELLACRGRVLTNTAEFPSSTIPWLWRKAQVVFQEARDGRVPLESLKGMLDKQVQTIVSSWVQYASGYCQDLETLGRFKKNRFLVINATQGLGALRADVEKWQADFLCTNSYKWLMAGYGCGLLYVREKWLKKFLPQGAGWRSMQQADFMDNRRLDLRKDAGRYEWGCPAFPSIFALGAALKYLKAIGLERIEKRVLELTDWTRSHLRDAGFEVVSSDEHPSGITVLRLPQAVRIARELLVQGIYVSARGPGLRVAPHFYNSFEEIETLVQKLKKIRSADSTKKKSNAK